jgi:hypothetical protein
MWTAPASERVIAMWRAGHSAAEIAGWVGKSRSAVLGVVFRAGANKRDLGPKRARFVPTITPRLERAAPLRPPWARCWMDYAPIVEPVSHEAVPASAVMLLELGAGQCRWPFGSGRSMMFCGADVERGYSYCSMHHTQSTRPFMRQR